MINSLIKYRFELFLTSQVTILFGALVFPPGLAELISTMLFYLNVIFGCFFIGKNKRLQIRLVFFFLIMGGILYFASWYWEERSFFEHIRFILFFLFHVLITYHIIKILWHTRRVNKTIILGMMSGFISLGFLGLFIFLSLELLNPGSFSGLDTPQFAENNVTESLMYFSYITLMTIGYGEITPLTMLARKATILIGFLGQFYLVIITAIIVGKFLNQDSGEVGQND